MIKLRLLILPLVILLSGCFFEKYRETAMYDFASPVQYCPNGIIVIVKEFDSTAGGGIKMRYRAENQQVLIDSYNSWIAAPEAMLTKYFSTAFTQSERDLLAEPCFILAGNLNTFDIDLVKQRVDIVLTYQLTERKNGKVAAFKEISASVPFENNNPPDFAAAATQAAKILADKIRVDLVNLAKADKK
jgi:ABC-type uncharacterized transport system auxiliary subunit